MEHYYPQCLQCKIETLIEPSNIQFEEENKCLLIELQCIQIIFKTKEIFEDFFQYHQELISKLFYKDNGTDQNTLHVIIKKNTLKEINIDYIEQIFQIKYQTYRVIFFELHIQNQNLIINRNLINITRLSMKLILVCGDRNQRIQTIYIIHNRNITLESKQDLCSTIFIPSSTIISSKSIIKSSSTSIITSSLTSIITSSSIELLSISREKSKDIVLIIILLTSFLLCLLTGLMIYCFKRIKHRYKRLSKTIDTISEPSISLDETPVTPVEKPKLSLKLKRPLRGVRALQLLDDDV